MRKVLFVATIDQHIRHFHYPFMKWFQDNGYEVHVASNGQEQLKYTDKKFDIQFDKIPIHLNNLKAYRQLSKLIGKENYELLHCHMPVGGVIGRLAAMKYRKQGLRVIYTAHGFHFFKGSSICNWLIFYPIEKCLSFITDVLITINDEDFHLAKRKFHAKRIERVNGVGVDLDKYIKVNDMQKFERRSQFGFKQDDIVLIFVAELSNRKNQQLLIHSMKHLRYKVLNLKLLLVGEGRNYDKYTKLIHDLNLQDSVILADYQRDISNFLSLCDIALSSSKQEGLPVNLLEAMAMGLPVIASNCRGNNDLIRHHVNGLLYESNDMDQLIKSIIYLIDNRDLMREFADQNLQLSKKYALNLIVAHMISIYSEQLNL